jgi:DNA (cytosine-5)-methyltransferase 1
MSEKLKVIELFAGLGTITQALKELGVEHEVVATSEIDRFAVQSYTAIHGVPNNLGDITKIKELPPADLWFYGFCCQDISVAGKLAGIKEGTRSGLLLEVERLLKTAAASGTLPKYLILENVKNLVGIRFKPDFDRWLCFLETLGYINYWKVLNTRDYCVPQNRERVFCVSVRGEHEPFVFPEKRTLRLRLKDMLDTEVDEKFYLSERALKSLGHSTYNQEKFRMQPLDGVHRTCCSRDYKSPTCVQVGTLSGGKWDKIHEHCRRVYDTDGSSPTIHCAGGGNLSLSKDKLPYPDVSDIPTKRSGE